MGLGQSNLITKKAVAVCCVLLISAITAGWMLGAGVLPFNGVLRAG